METPYGQMQSLTQTPFAYFSSDGRLEVQSSDLDQQHHDNPNHTLLYQTQMSQPLHSFHLFSSSEMPNNTIPFPQMYHNGYNGPAPMSSPPYKKENLITSNIPTNLLIKSSIHDSDMYYYPSTPPLSASPSVSGSPDYSGLPTPVNAAIFGVQQSKDEIHHEISNWIQYGSPPITPAFVQSDSLINNASHNEVLSAQGSINSPPAPPLSTQLHPEPDVDFCDPRKLTVCSNLHSEKTSALSNVSQLPTCPNSEDHKYLLNGAISTRNLESKEANYQAIHQSEIPHVDQSDLGSGDHFYCGFSSFSIPESTFYMTTKRQRTDSGISLSNGSTLGSVDFHQLEESGNYCQTVSNCPLSPPSSISEKDRKNAKRMKKIKKMNPDSPPFGLSNIEIYKPDLLLRTDKYSIESNNDDKNYKSTGPSNSGGSEKGKVGDLSKSQHQVTRRGRKQSETEDLTKTFVCESCSRRFKRQEHLKRHYRSVHTQEKPFKCHECGKDFSRSDNLSQHARTHGNSSVVVGLENGELSNDVDASCEHIGNLSSVLFNVAAATPGSETDRSSQCSSNSSCSTKDVQSRKKRRRPE